MKKILVIGAGFLQSFLIKRAKEIGYYTIAIDKKPNSIGFKYSDESEVIDIIDQKACLEYALHHEVDGVITAATDYGVLTAAYIAKKMKLPGLDYESAKIIKNKYMVRSLLYEKRVDDVSQYYEVKNLSTINEIINKIKFPVMVKPSDGSGSKAVKKVESMTTLYETSKRAIKHSLIGKALIEDFICGKEYGVESFVYNGKVYVLGVIDKNMTPPPIHAELGHSMPSQLSPENQDKVEEVIKKAIKALGINFGAVNMDVLITKDNRVNIIDVGARMGGNLIGSHVIPIGLNFDYLGVLAKTAVGDPIELKIQASNKVIVTKLLSLTPGTVEELPNFAKIKEKCKVEIHSHLKIGDTIKEYKNNLDGWGYVIAVTDNHKDAHKKTDKALKMIDEKIIRKQEV